MPRVTGPVFDLPSASAAGVTAWVANLLAAPVTAELADVIIMRELPGLAPEEIAAIIDLAGRARAAGLAFGVTDETPKVALQAIPVCPGCPPNLTEVRAVVSIVDGSGRLVTQGDVTCVTRGIPDAEDLRACYETWAAEISERHYPGLGLVTTTPDGERRVPGLEWRTTFAQRGLFFGK